MSEMKWSERYNCYSARVGRVGFLGANWSSGGWKVSAFGVSQKTPMGSSIDEAQAQAERLGRRLLQEAIDALPTPPGGDEPPRSE